MNTETDSAKSLADKSIIFVTVENDQDLVKTDYGNRHIQMGQRMWRSMMSEVVYILEQYEITGRRLTGITVWHSPMDALVQSAVYCLTVQSISVEVLRDRLHRLVTSQPYELLNGPGVLRAAVV